MWLETGHRRYLPLANYHFKSNHFNNKHFDNRHYTLFDILGEVFRFTAYIFTENLKVKLVLSDHLIQFIKWVDIRKLFTHNVVIRSYSKLYPNTIAIFNKVIITKTLLSRKMLAITRRLSSFFATFTGGRK